MPPELKSQVLEHSVNNSAKLELATAPTASNLTPDISMLIARNALTGAIQAIDFLTSPQKEVMDSFGRGALFARESGNHNSLSAFVMNGLELAFFTSAFDLGMTPLASHFINESRKKVFG